MAAARGSERSTAPLAHLLDQEAGAKQGKRVGEYIIRHALRPVRKRAGPVHSGG